MSRHRSEAEKNELKGEKKRIQRERLAKVITYLIFIFNLQFMVRKSRSDKIVQTNKQTRKPNFPFGRDQSALLADKIK